MPKITVHGGPSHSPPRPVGVVRATSRPVGAPAAAASPVPHVAPPAPTARKSEWVAYAEALGFDVDGLTKAEIRELVG